MAIEGIEAAKIIIYFTRNYQSCQREVLPATDWAVVIKTRTYGKAVFHGLTALPCRWGPTQYSPGIISIQQTSPCSVDHRDGFTV